MEAVIQVSGLAKGFTLHTQGGVHIPVFSNLNLTVQKGQCVALYGPSGSGKSSLLRCLYANYLPQEGSIMVRHQDGWVDMARAEPPSGAGYVRQNTMGYVSQFFAGDPPGARGGHRSRSPGRSHRGPPGRPPKSPRPC